MRQIELYVPTTDNHGQDIYWGYWHTLETSLRDRFQGFTTYRANGQWQDGPTTHIDPIKVYRIVCEDDRAEFVRYIARFIKKHWRQESVFYTVQDVEATFV